MRMKTKTYCAGHSIFFAVLPSNYVDVENTNKHPFPKVEGWALIRGGHLFNDFTTWVDGYSRGRLFEGALVQGLTVDNISGF